MEATMSNPVASCSVNCFTAFHNSLVELLDEVLRTGLVCLRGKIWIREV
jgi:hypothetical protein